MSTFARLPRRHVLLGLSALAVAPALAQVPDLVPDSDADQTAALQAALDGARTTGRLSLPPGRFRVSGLRFAGNMLVEGVPGATILVANGAAVGSVSAQSNLVLRDIGFAGDSDTEALLDIDASDAITLERCWFSDSPGLALGIRTSAGIVRDCSFAGHGDAAIHAVDNLGLLITGNRITRCGNAGVRVWRSEAGHDGTIVTGNRISDIDWRDGGNGQNGNGINVYLADSVVVADNHISGCAFTAVRLNTARNSQVSGNQCLDSGEVAIFSEFAFSGSIIANNLVDGAAAGISMTNLDTGGQIAVCTGNIVRNIAAASAVNPDTVPYGIAAEADAAITGNLVENCPGVAILAGWGPYLRNVAIANNVVLASRIGIAVSLAEGAGAVSISGNRIEATEHTIAGMLWTEVAEPDLAAVAENYPQLSID